MSASPRDPRRNAMIGKIKVAVKQLRMVEDDYMAIKIAKGGVTTLSGASIPQLERILAEMKRLGFVEMPAKGKAKPASRVNNPTARKARALWISLGQLCVIRDTSERALEAFVKRQMNVSAFAWADEGLMYKVIEALKNMAERNGWSQDTKGAGNASHALQILKMNLCLAIVAKMHAKGLVPEAWTLAVVLHRLCGIETTGSPMAWGVETLDLAARALGEKLAQDTSSISGE